MTFSNQVLRIIINTNKKSGWFYKEDHPDFFMLIYN
jgi:hypothetical protein